MFPGIIAQSTVYTQIPLPESASVETQTKTMWEHGYNLELGKCSVNLWFPSYLSVYLHQYTSPVCSNQGPSNFPLGPAISSSPPTSLLLLYLMESCEQCLGQF